MYHDCWPPAARHVGPPAVAGRGVGSCDVVGGGRCTRNAAMSICVHASRNEQLAVVRHCQGY